MIMGRSVNNDRDSPWACSIWRKLLMVGFALSAGVLVFVYKGEWSQNFLLVDISFHESDKNTQHLRPKQSHIMKQGREEKYLASMADVNKNQDLVNESVTNHSIQRNKVTKRNLIDQAEENSAADTGDRIPSVLLAGAQKASTSSLALYLYQNVNNTCYSDPTDVSKSGHSEILGKEPHFFDLQYDQGLERYKYLFRKCQPEDILIDASPINMLFPEEVHKIYEQQGMKDKVKIIFILREPVSREISWYNHRLRELDSPNPPDYATTLLDRSGKVRPFRSIADDLVKDMKAGNYGWERGYYAYWLKRWIEYFDREQILILSFNELMADPETLLRRVHEFLDIPITKTTLLELSHTNSDTKHIPSPPCEDQLVLAEVFDEPNKELYEFLSIKPGPVMEQRPFPKIHVKCRRNDDDESENNQ